MSKNFLLILAALCTLIFARCSTMTTDFIGRPCVALTETETARLVAIARAGIKKNSSKGIVTKSEAAFVIRNRPQVRIQYRGDKFGTAYITWRTKKRILEMRFDYDLTATLPTCALTIADAPDDKSRMPDKSLSGR
ncbi:MAG: hypothetical protein IKD22_00750 [Lentisphaeria bacterium]|nr:hypothetical protein [Lentisphaeria bacterium]